VQTWLDISLSSKRVDTETLVSGALLYGLLRLSSTSVSTTKGTTTWLTNAHAFKQPIGIYVRANSYLNYLFQNSWLNEKHVLKTIWFDLDHIIPAE